MTTSLKSYFIANGTFGPGGGDVMLTVPAASATNPVVSIQGKTFTVSAVSGAIQLLQSHGTTVKGPLAQAKNPLAVLSVAEMAKEHLNEHKGKGRVRRAVVSYLQQVLLNAKIPIPSAEPITWQVDKTAGKYVPASSPGTPDSPFEPSVNLATATKADEDDEDEDEDDEDEDDEEPAQPEKDPPATPDAPTFVPLQHVWQVRTCAYGVEGCECSHVTTQSKAQPIPEAPQPQTYTTKGLFQYNDDTGYVKQAPGLRELINEDSYGPCIKRVKDTFGAGVVAARSTQFTYGEQVKWANAWYNGDLRTCWEIERRKGDVHPEHPGAPDNPDTNHLIWEPAVPGELPAGVLPPGDWPNPLCLSAAVVGNYLIAAKLANPTRMGKSTRWSWVCGHMMGNKYTTDQLSVQTYSASQGTQPAPKWTDGQIIDRKPLEDFAGQSPSQWPLYALADYLTAHPDCVPASTYHTWRLAAVTEHLAECRRAALRALLTPRYTLAPDQPTLSGYHTKAVVLDQFQRRWLFKPAAEGRRFRADVEHHAHVVARRFGYRTAESRLDTYDGQFGQFQRLFDVSHDLAGWTGSDLLTLSTVQLSQLAREHVLDWAIDNDDSHGENIVVTTAGDVVGIDKGRAWRYFGSWPGLTGTTAADTNCKVIYTVLYTAITAGVFQQDVIDGVYADVIAQAHRMQALPDEDLHAIITAAQEHRPHYQPPHYQPPCAQAPGSLDELITAATDRKNRLAQDMRQLWASVYDRAGWSLPDLTAPAVPARNPQGHHLHTGLHDPALHTAVTRTRNFGTATFVAGRHIEDAHVLLWREKHQSNGFITRGHFKLRAGAEFTAVRAYCKARSGWSSAITGDTGEPVHEDYAGYHDTIIAAAKSVTQSNTQSGFRRFDVKLRDALFSVRSALRNRRDELRAMSAEPDPDHRIAAELKINTVYLGYTLQVQEAYTFRYATFEDGSMPAQYWIKPIPPDPDDPVTVTLIKCRRSRSSTGTSPNLDPDGELIVGDDVIIDNDINAEGQAGRMYQISLATGETITFRADNEEGILLATHGTVEFSIPGTGDITAPLQRVTEQLTTMGCPLQPATTHDLELFYWRHLTAILRDRVDTKPSTGALAKFWATADAIDTTDDPAAEITALRTAFATHTSPEHIEAFTAGGGHLPRFMHMDLRNPNQPTGKPYWERFDVTDTDWRSKAMPTALYRSGPILAATTGVCLSTEARTRTLAIWKPGQSSISDLAGGSGGFVFTRQNAANPDTFNSWGVVFSPHILKRTHNYAYDTDLYGNVAQRKEAAHWDFTRTTALNGGSNELMVKEALSILDDVDMLVFNNPKDINAVTALYTSLGITEIRGMPLATRLTSYQELDNVRFLLGHHTDQRRNP